MVGGSQRGRLQRVHLLCVDAVGSVDKGKADLVAGQGQAGEAGSETDCSPCERAAAGLASSHSHLALAKSETFTLLGGHHPLTASSSLKSEKRSLASKLSGTLNRSNSGKTFSR